MPVLVASLTGALLLRLELLKAGLADLHVVSAGQALARGHDEPCPTRRRPLSIRADETGVVGFSCKC